MSPEKKFELGDYVEVKDRIAKFYELFGKGSLVTDSVDILTAPDGTQRVLVRALAYRNPDDQHPGVGHSWLQLPGKTPYTNGSEVENAETSAWGRAIGSLGILIDASIATTNEIADKVTHPEDKDEQEVHLGPITRTGVVVKGSGHGTNLEWRETPDGHAIGFLLEVGDGKPKPEVLIEGILGRALFAAMSMDVEKLAGQKVELDGEVFEVHRPKPRKMAYRIRPTRIVTDTWSIPAPAEVGKFDDGEPVELGLDA